MSYVLSEPVENLIEDQSCDQFEKQCEVLIVGSGYGGAIAAMRLADQNREVFVFERGDEYRPGDFPESLGDLPGHIQFLRPDRDVPIGYANALFDFRIDDPVSVLVGNGLGGGSLINANVAMEPGDEVFSDSKWPAALRNNKATLAAGFCAVRKLLGVNDAGFQSTGKFKGLTDFAEGVPAVRKSPARAASIAVSQEDGPNAVGIHQKKCVECGNCVTGCNHEAKNTLAMNALPLAKSRGAKLYTGATVLSIEPCGSANGPQEWKVRFRRTAISKTVLHREVFALRAKVVILAAGTLGSTEILLRSQAHCPDKLKFSECLGTRFSTNGDVLAFGYAQPNELNAVAHADVVERVETERKSHSHIGPTITGYLKADTSSIVARPESGRRRQVTLEDGAVPSALAQLFGELVTTASLPKRYVKNDLPAWFVHPEDKKKDPLAMHPEALRHSQVLLGMGDDGARWRLKLRYSDNDKDKRDHDRTAIRIFQDAESAGRESDGLGKTSVFEDIHELLKKAEKNGAFDGGDYLPNPLWKLMPDGFSQVSNAPAPGGNLFSVHPLGGSPMGDDRDRGVVDHYGRVFRGDVMVNRSVYDGLYVMDGAILPCALGVNPFLTIAALAYRNSEEVGNYLRSKLPAKGIEGRVDETLNKRIYVEEKRSGAQRQDVLGHRVNAKFEERMMGRLCIDRVPQWLIDSFEEGLRAKAKELHRDKALVVTATIDIENVLHWLRAPDTKLPASAQLFFNRKENSDTALDEHLVKLAEGKGEVALLEWDRPARWPQKVTRALWAIATFFVRRGFGGTLGAVNSWRERWEAVKGFWRVACNHANWRAMRYKFKLHTATGREITLAGTKQLAYALGKKNLWTALTELPITLEGSGSVQGILRVDAIRLTRRSPFQVVESPNTPITIAAMVSAGMMMLRVLFQTHFWSFGAPDYPQEKFVSVADPAQWPGTERDSGAVRLTNKARIEPERIPLFVPLSSDDRDGEKIEIRLTRYRPAKIERNSILLIHGLAHGSRVFATDTTTLNFAAYLYENGYDVWLLDHRLSIALPDRARGGWLAEKQWTMDQIAGSDMAEAVKYVYEATEKKPVQVFAHCIGAGCFAMAVLRGACHDFDWNRGEGRSMIFSLALHAVHPWMAASPMNHVKANLAAFFKDTITWKTLDPVPPDQTTVTASDVLLDRVAGSLPWFPWTEALRHRFGTDKRMGKEICNRMTLFYGYEWNHSNLTCETHKALKDLVGIANFETFRQIYFILQRRRLTTRDGEDTYVKDKNFKKFWTFPTLFAHGSDNQVFSPASALRSFLRLHALRQQIGIGRAPNHDVYWLEVPHYGHMDFLFGKDAHAKVYPQLDAFYRRAQGAPLPSRFEAASEKLNKVPKPDLDPTWDPVGRPTCGPIIGQVRRHDNAVVLRLWVEPYLFSAIDAPGNSSVPEGFKIAHRLLPRPAWDNRPYPGTYWVYDLSLPPEFEQELRISIDYVNPIDIKFRVEAADSPHRDKKLKDRELHENKGVIIPLAKLSWFKRLKQDGDSGAVFLVGSCHYPGSPFDEELADKVFRAMLRHVDDSHSVTGDTESKDIDHVLLVGDQIYADATADAFDTGELRERFARRYREAFSAPYLRRLLTSVPIHMAFDDHEFEDNWPGDADTLSDRGNKGVKDYMERFQHGLAAAKAYQWSMSSRSGWPDGLWHTFESGGLPFFVMDTRTERTLRRASVPCEAARLVNEMQFNALKMWLVSSENRNKPKFIVSGSVLAPVARSFTQQKWLWRNNDGWAGYPKTWRELVKYIVDNQIRNVVFIAGDYHLSAVAQLTLLSKGKKPVIAYQIAASALFAPLPFANARPSDYDWANATPSRSQLPFSDPDAALEVEPYLLSTNRSHFLRVEAQPLDGAKWSMAIRVCDSTGVIAPEMVLKGRFTAAHDNAIRWTL